MLANQGLGLLWDRARPPKAHPGKIIGLTTISPDSSFPSDHAAAAFGIAVAALLTYRFAGRILLAVAIVVALSRVAVGAHYPTDVLAGAAVGSIMALLVTRLHALWLPLVNGLARLTDPLLRGIQRLPGLRTVVG